MAIPILYWMLECTGCHCRFVVHDSYLEFVGTHTPNPDPGDGYGAVPLPSRYRCVRGCPDPLQAVASMFTPEDDEMRLAEPYISVELPRTLRKEWRYLAADPTRFVQTPFPHEQFLAEYARRYPVLTMTDHDGTRRKLPDVREALRWFGVMEPGNTVSFVRRDGTTLDVRRDGQTYSVRLVFEGDAPVEAAGLTGETARARIARYFSDSPTQPRI